MRPALMWILAGIWFLTSAETASAERNWEFSFGAFGGKAYHANTTGRFNYANNGAGVEPTDMKAIGLRFDDSATFGAKISAWYLPHKSWQPQIGVESDWTSFTADLQPQDVRGQGFGKISGIQIGRSMLFTRRDFAVNNLAINLLFRYPIEATPEMPQGRWYPYVGIGAGVQRANLTEYSTGNQESSYSPSFQGLIGAKFFFIKNLAIFAEWRWTQGWHSFTYSGVGGFPPDYRERFTIATSHVVGGVALHF